MFLWKWLSVWGRPSATAPGSGWRCRCSTTLGRRNETARSECNAFVGKARRRLEADSLRGSLCCLRHLRHFATRHTTAAGLFGDALPNVQHTAVQQPLDELSLVHQRIIAPDLAPHGLG